LNCQARVWRLLLRTPWSPSFCLLHWPCYLWLGQLCLQCATKAYHATPYLTTWIIHIRQHCCTCHRMYLCSSWPLRLSFAVLVVFCSVVLPS
jgi:hypothetical protein